MSSLKYMTFYHSQEPSNCRILETTTKDASRECHIVSLIVWASDLPVNIVLSKFTCIHRTAWGKFPNIVPVLSLLFSHMEAVLCGEESPVVMMDVRQEHGEDTGASRRRNNWRSVN